MLTKVLDAVSDILAKEHDTESLGTQDTIASMEENNMRDDIGNLVVFSSDVKSLYPSLKSEDSHLRQEGEREQPSTGGGQLG